MSGVLAHTIRLFDEAVVATGRLEEPSVSSATGASSTTTVVLAVLGLVVSSFLVIRGWKIIDRRRNEDRTADIDNDDLSELITLLRALDVEIRRISALPRPADRADLREVERLIPYTESYGDQSTGVLQARINDIVKIMKELTEQPVDASAPIGMLAPLIRQQARTADRLQGAVAQALAEARQARA